MAAINLTLSGPLTFILNGIPGLEAAYIWISITFSVFYIICLLENFTVLLVVSKEQTLHKPMYLLLCMLALTDIGMSTSVVPKALCIFWLGFKDITLDGCLTQIFVTNTLGVMHSAVLVTMAFDRYVAICDPLRYTTILTNPRIALLGIMGLIRAVLLNLPVPLLLHRLPFCINRVFSNVYCEFMAVVNMLCTDTSDNWMYGLVMPLGVILSDLTLIGLSYVLIIRAVIWCSSKKVYQKALNTCTTHICVMLMYYIPILFSVLTHRFGQSIPAHVYILSVNLYLLVPPMINPIIYGVKTKELREKVGKYIFSLSLSGATDLKDA